MLKLLSSRSGAVIRLRLARPEVHNALDAQLIAELHRALDELEGDSSPRVLILESEGSTFCAGADLRWMLAEGEKSAQENRASALALAQLYARISALPCPTVARAQGPAFGGGVGLLCSTDLALAADTAFFSLSEARLGLVPAVIGPHVVRRIGFGRARELMLTGRRVNAAEALTLGLVHRVTAAADLDSALEALAGDLLRCGPEALATTKRLLRDICDPVTGPSPGEKTAEALALTRAGAEAREGIRAFLEKRPASWAPGESR